MLVLSLAAVLPAGAGAAGPENSLDHRGWELVSPVDVAGGQVGEPQDPGAGAFQSAANGEAIAYGSTASSADAAGAPPISQYLATRAPTGWATANVSPPLLSGTYAGGAYQLFSTDLSRALLSNGWRCRDGGSACGAENPSLAGNAPLGYRTLYLREAGAYESLLSTANSPALSVPATEFELSLAGATPALQHAVISTCAALTADAVQIPAGPGCVPAATNLYRWSGGALTAINFLPGEPQTAPGATLAAPAGAISADGNRVYFSHAGDLYLREGAVTKPLATDAEFEVASADGSVAFYRAAGHLYRFDALAVSSEDLTPAGGALGVLGASATGSHVYYLSSAGLFLQQGSTVTKVATGADPSNLPASTGTARVTPDGSRLAFVSSASLTGFPNAGKAEAYLYEAPASRLLCVSCNAQGTTPLGPAGIPPAQAAAEGPPAYKPRALSADGTRLFFSSGDRLVAADTDGLSDVYEWEAGGSGTCAVPAGCIGLISFGRAGADTLLDASADGRDAFFLTPVSLVGADLGGVDVYDARAGGGFPEPSPPISCEGDICAPIVLPPSDPAPGTATVQGLPNPRPKYVTPKTKKPKQKKGKCKKSGQRKCKGKRKGGRR